MTRARAAFCGAGRLEETVCTATAALRCAMTSGAGPAPQLTVRALATGALIGALMCLSNLYLGLQTGFAVGVALPACLIAHSAFAMLGRVAPRRFHPLSLLESNAMMTM